MGERSRPIEELIGALDCCATCAGGVLNRYRAEAWAEGHAAGQDYAGDGWNGDTHDPRDDNPYLPRRSDD